MTRSGASVADARFSPFVAGLAALPLLLFTYMPRPGLPGSQFVVYPMLAVAVGMLLVFLLSRRESIDPRLIRLGFLLLLFDVVVAISFISNALALRASAPSEIFRVVLLAILLLYGYSVARFGDRADVRRGLLGAAILILLGQLLIATTQIAGLEVFGRIYNAEKSRPFGSLLRATGSFGNPGIFAWTAAQAGVIAFVLDGRRTRYLALLVAMLLVVAGGSRSVLLLFPFMVAFTAIGTGSGGGSRRLYLILAGVVAAIFVFAVWMLGEYLPYLAQLKLVVASGSLTSINSINARFVHWQELFVEMARAGWGVWLFGLGSRPITAVMDNDFLYVLFKFGVVGLLMHLGILVYVGYLFVRSRERTIAWIGLEYLVFALVLGLVADTLAGWSTPLILFLLLGIAVGLHPEEGGRRSGVRSGAEARIGDSTVAAGEAG